MEQALDIVRLLAISHLVIIGLLLFKSYPKHQITWVTVAFLWSLIGYLGVEIIDWSSKPEEPHVAILIVASSFPYMFWMMSKAYFDDEFTLKSWMGILLVGIFITLLLLFFGLRPYFSPDSIIVDLINLVPYFLSLTFLILGIIEAARNYSADLLVSRHKFRLVFMVGVSILMALTIITEISFEHQTPLALDLIQKSTILALIYYFSYDLLQFKAAFFEDTATANAPKATTPTTTIDPQMIKLLMNLMDEQKIYRTEGLTIRVLAEQMQIKEYKLRRAINQHLGFRNFNAFLNAYRIDEAKSILSDKNKHQLTILEIAYDLGYASLAPFNKAFKKNTGMTPSEYRSNLV